jgi:hypothetical protein
MSDFMDKVYAGVLGGIAGLAIKNNRKDGGSVKRKTPYLVGEEGPEIIVPDSDGVVIPSSRSKKVSNWLSNKGLELSFNDKDDDKSNVVIDKLFQKEKKKKEKKKKEKKEPNVIDKLGLGKFDLTF